MHDAVARAAASECLHAWTHLDRFNDPRFRPAAFGRRGAAGANRPSPSPQEPGPDAACRSRQAGCIGAAATGRKSQVFEPAVIGRDRVAIHRAQFRESSSRRAAGTAAEWRVRHPPAPAASSGDSFSRHRSRHINPSALAVSAAPSTGRCSGRRTAATTAMIPAARLAYPRAGLPLSQSSMVVQFTQHSTANSRMANASLTVETLGPRRERRAQPEQERHDGFLGARLHQRSWNRVDCAEVDRDAGNRRRRHRENSTRGRRSRPATRTPPGRGSIWETGLARCSGATWWRGRSALLPAAPGIHLGLSRGGVDQPDRDHE